MPKIYFLLFTSLVFNSINLSGCFHLVCLFDEGVTFKLKQNEIFKYQAFAMAIAIFIESITYSNIQYSYKYFLCLKVFRMINGCVAYQNNVVIHHIKQQTP